MAPATLHTSGEGFVLVALVSFSTLVAACSGEAFTTARGADAGPGGAGGESGSSGQATGGKAGTGGRGTGGRAGTGGASGGTPGSSGAPSGGASGSGGTIAAGGSAGGTIAAGGTPTGGLGGVPVGSTGGSPGTGGLPSGGTGGAAGSGGAGGAGTGVCDPTSSTAACDQCIQAKCCAEFLACDSGCSSEFNCYVTCFIGVGDPALCASDCASQTGVLDPSTSALVTCIQVQEGANQRCSIPCYGYNVP